MAPSAIETITITERPSVRESLKNNDLGSYKDLASVGYEKEKEEEGENAAKYKHYLPSWDPNEHYEPLKSFEHYEHGKDADTTYPELLGSGATVSDLTPNIGSEVTGVQLSSLSPAGKDQLARYVAERRVVAFRDQDFADLPIDKALEFGGYFGRHHIHPTSGQPKGFPEIHLVHRAYGDKSADSFFEKRTNSVAWHSDITYEQQPPGTTFLYILDVPETGGDTLFSSGVEAYKRLSPAFRERLHGLKAVHSGFEQVYGSVKKNGAMRRDPVMSEHPIIRTHPATGEKALYVNPQFTRHIVGYKDEESQMLLKFLYDHIALGQDFQARVKWAPKTVVVWDNRVTQHTALVDWNSGQRRHLARITPQAERPYETPFEG